MPITYRSEKGSPLTVQEIDGNFKELETRLVTLEEQSEAGEGIGKIHVEGDQIQFIGSFGTDFGSFTLPIASLNPCGGWKTQIPYKKLDLVTVENVLYCCMREHTSTTWGQDNLFWKQVFALPPPPSLSFPLYEKDSLPEQESMGKLAVLLELEGSTLIFFNGNKWQRLMKGDTL